MSKTRSDRTFNTKTIAVKTNDGHKKIIDLGIIKDDWQIHSGEASDGTYANCAKTYISTDTNVDVVLVGKTGVDLPLYIFTFAEYENLVGTENFNQRMKVAGRM